MYAARLKIIKHNIQMTYTDYVIKVITCNPPNLITIIDLRFPMINAYNCIMFMLFLFYIHVNYWDGKGCFVSLKIIILNPEIESMVCTTPSVVLHVCI